MNKPGPGNSFNVNIAIHMPNTPKHLSSTGVTILNSEPDGDKYDVEGVRKHPGTVRFDDVVEISSTARKLAERRRQRLAKLK